jgi:hypothetical protein
MAQRPIRWFDPRERRPHAPSVPQEEWEKYRAQLKQMYLEDGLKLEEVMKIMKDEYSFAPSYVYPPLHPGVCRNVFEVSNSCQLQQTSVYLPIL